MKISQCNHQLGFTRVILTESMLQMCQHVVWLKEGHDILADNVLKQLADNTGEGLCSVICFCMHISKFVDWCYECIWPILRYDSVSSDWLKRAVIIGAFSSANSFGTRFGILSGPAASCGFLFSSNLLTPVSVTLILGIFFLAGPSQVIASVSSCVKTLLLL